jgi:CheY-like chemotaxis protein
MSVFISHSFDNQPEFENVADALEHVQVPYWNPAEVKAGCSLRDQLRQAVEHCSVCIFVATFRAIESSWCGAELGAFWGTGKPIIVYLADSSLPEENLPPILQGDVWERRIARVVSRAKELVHEVSASPSPNAKLASTHVGNMTIEQLERLIVGAVALAAATDKNEKHAASAEEIGLSAKNAAGRVLEGIRTSERLAGSVDNRWRSRILWVDDRPGNNAYERQAFESMGITFTLALSTQEALSELSKQRFAAIISDMGRKEGPKEGYVLLEKVRQTDRQTPFFIYAGSNAPEHQREAIARGAQGTTNRPRDLVDMVIQALPEKDSA